MASDKKKSKKAAKRGKKENIVDGVPTDLVYVKKSPTHGKGMFATKRIAKNITLGPLIGTPTKEDGTYVLWLTAKQGFRVINDYRFINHSKDANCALTDCDVITLKTIEPDEELFHDYGW